jgi:5'-nucleotidase
MPVLTGPCPQDISLAKALNALSPAAQNKHDITNAHGVDIILGGHDHLYYVSRGVTSWEGYDTKQAVLGAEEDQGDVLVVKVCTMCPGVRCSLFPYILTAQSGTDFRDLSSFNLELEDTPAGSVRRKVVKSIKGLYWL